MVNMSGIPRPVDNRTNKRLREEAARKMKQSTSARNTSSSTIGAGGMLTLDGGGIDVTNGGLGRVRDGGKWSVEGGGSMDITDDGEVNVIGNGRGYSSDRLITVIATLANRLAYNAWIGFSYLVPGLYFTAEGESQGPYDPRVVSSDGKGVDAYSAVEDLPYGPQVGPNIKSRGSFGAGTWNAGVGVHAWDDSINPGGGDGVAGVRGAASISVTPWDLSILLTNHTDGPDGIPSGAAIWMRGDLEEGMLRIYTRNGLDVEGGFTVNGQPVGGAVTSVAGKTGDVSLAKGDVGLGNVDNTSDANKPVSNATQTALNGKASATHTHATATTSAAGFMSAADKTKLDAAATTMFVNGLKRRFRRVPGTGLGTSIASSTTNWTSFGSTVTVPADLFGVGVPYIITAYAQAAGWPVAGAVFSLRLLFSGTQPDGAKTNSPNGQHNATTTVSYDFEVTTSREVIVAAQAQSAFGSSAIGQGADQAFYTVTATPYTAL